MNRITLKMGDGLFQRVSFSNDFVQAMKFAEERSRVEPARDWRVFQIGQAGYVAVRDSIPAEYVELIAHYLDGEVIS